MKLKDFQNDDPSFKLAKFLRELEDDDVMRVADIHKELGIPRAKVFSYIQQYRPPTYSWGGRLYVGTIKSIKAFKKLVGGK